MASNRGELTTSAAGISRSHDETHSSSCGLVAALAGRISVSARRRADATHLMIENTELEGVVLERNFVRAIPLFDLTIRLPRFGNALAYNLELL